MFKTGLLIVTRPWHQVKGQIPSYLAEVNRLVSSTLYVHFQPEFNLGKPDQLHNSQKLLHSVQFNADARHVVRDFYATGARLCGNLDMRVLLGNVSNSPCFISKYELRNVCDLVMVDCLQQDSSKSDILKLIGSRFSVQSDVSLECFDICGDDGGVKSAAHDEEVEGTNAKRRKLEDATDENTDNILQHNNVALGGTFDRLHTGHKLLLSEGCLLATQSLTVGVTIGDMNKKKVLCELIKPVDRRISVLRDFLEDVKPVLEYKLVPIMDVYGPTITDPDLDLIVLSQETKKGGEIINTEREKKDMKRMAEYTIDLLEDNCRNQYEENKISSSSLRKRLLGTLFHPLKASVDVTDRPYVIGLTGGIASGKSAICKRLEGLGCVTVDCDKLGHRAYVKGSPGFDKVVEAFGQDIVGEDGEVDRKALGKIVFADKKNLEKLNQLVWPEIASLAKEQIEKFSKAGHKVIILEAAILLEAGWDSMTHEVWVTIIPVEEAVRRIVERNNLSEDQARQRVSSQITNVERVEKSHVILSSLWEYEYTQSQVEKAWSLLKKRIGLNDVPKSNM